LIKRRSSSFRILSSLVLLGKLTLDDITGGKELQGFAALE